MSSGLAAGVRSQRCAMASPSRASSGVTSMLTEITPMPVTKEASSSTPRARADPKSTKPNSPPCASRKETRTVTARPRPNSQPTTPIARILSSTMIATSRAKAPGRAPMAPRSTDMPTATKKTLISRPLKGSISAWTCR